MDILIIVCLFVLCIFTFLLAWLCSNLQNNYEDTSDIKKSLVVLSKENSELKDKINVLEEQQVIMYNDFVSNHKVLVNISNEFDLMREYLQKNDKFFNEKFVYITQKIINLENRYDRQSATGTDSKIPE